MPARLTVIALFAALGLGACSGGPLFQPGPPAVPTGEVADMAPRDVSVPGPAPAGGFFARLFSRRDAGPDLGRETPTTSPAPGAPAAEEAAPDGPVPFGQVGRACSLPRKRLGRKVDQLSGYQLYDSIPNATAPRPFYITGFSDGCPRTFTAAIAMLGSAAMHETFRYLPASRGIATSSTDRAYEDLKARVCGAPKGKPCGRAIGRLERKTAFVTAYPEFGTNDLWMNALLHNGDVLAFSTSAR